MGFASGGLAYLGAQNLEHPVLKGFTRNDNEVLCTASTSADARAGPRLVQGAVPVAARSATRGTASGFSRRSATTG